MRAVRLFQTLFGVCENAAEKLSSRPEQIAEGVERLKAAVSSLERELNETRQREALRKIDSLLDGAQMISGVPLVSARLPEMPMDALRSLASGLIEREKCIALLASEKADGFNLIFARNPAIDADMGKLLREAATSCGGKGGGRGDFAQGSAKEARALELAVQILRGSL